MTNWKKKYYELEENFQLMNENEIKKILMKGFNIPVIKTLELNTKVMLLEEIKSLNQLVFSIKNYILKDLDGPYYEIDGKEHIPVITLIENLLSHLPDIIKDCFSNEELKHLAFKKY